MALGFEKDLAGQFDASNRVNIQLVLFKSKIRISDRRLWIINNQWIIDIIYLIYTHVDFDCSPKKHTSKHDDVSDMDIVLFFMPTARLSFYKTA